jgi:multisubunit Na+/H+ antiporter MnhF subunit
MTRWAVFVTFVAAEFWQLVFGTGTSLALANPRVIRAADWVPNVLVGETYTILPIGFILCLWGALWGRRLAAVGAVASILLAFVASATVSARPLDVSEFAVYFALLVAPGLALMVCALRTRPARAVDAMS